MPKSIERFEQLFFVQLVLGIVLQIVTWDSRIAQWHSNPLAERMGDGILLIAPAIGVAISLLLWFFIARRGSEVAKWIYIVLFALAVLGVVLALAVRLPEGTPQPDMITRIGGLVGVLLQAAGIWFLFQPDARLWFNKGVDPNQ